MIVLLSCSINLYATNTDSSTGEQDSVLISYDDLRLANSKLIELKYTKEINVKLRQIISNDSISINSYERINASLTQGIKKYKRQRNIAIGVLSALAAALVVSLFK